MVRNQQPGSQHIITVNSPFAGTLALQPDMNPGTTIASVDSVKFDGPEEVEATDLKVNRAYRRSLQRSGNGAGTYTVTVTVTTIDSQVIPTTGTLKVY